jgi:hypothetical protein
LSIADEQPSFAIDFPILERVATLIKRIEGDEPSQKLKEHILALLAGHHHVSLGMNFFIASPPALVLLVAVFGSSPELRSILELFTRLAAFSI